MGDLTHLDAQGTARMVDVGAKEVTARRAVARAVVRMTPATAERVAAGDAPKGDVLGVARIAGIQAAKRTGELIPLCHPIGLDHVDVDAALDAAEGTVTLTATAAVTARTGVEMEAMTAAAVAALTVYDMVKGLERGVRVEEVVLLRSPAGAAATGFAALRAARDPRIVAVADLRALDGQRHVDGSRQGDRQRDDKAVGIEVSGDAGQRLGPASSSVVSSTTTRPSATLTSSAPLRRGAATP